MRRTKHFSCLFGLIMGLLLCMNQAKAEYTVCYVPKSQDEKAKNSKEILVGWHYFNDENKFTSFHVYTIDNKDYNLIYELPKEVTSDNPMPTFKPETGTDRATIKWMGKTGNNGFSGELSVTDDTRFERSFAKIQMPNGGPYYYTHAICVRSTSDKEDIDTLLVKLRQKVQEINGVSVKILTPPAKL